MIKEAPLFIFFIYFILLFGVTFWSYRREKSDTYFVIGNRSLNYWLTALSAQASDMSNWLFMAFPASIYMGGMINIWTAIGLITIMFCNWQFLAPKVRIATEKSNSLTLNAYFENCFQDTSGLIRTTASIMSLLFFTFYISAGLVGMGLLGEALFQLNYTTSITIGLGIVCLYVFLGGYVTVAWIDLFQGFFLLAIILFIPLHIIFGIGGLKPITAALNAKHLTTSLIPDFSLHTLKSIIFLSLGWGLGYLGQPHIITKFMGIRNVADMGKAKMVGTSWLTLSLFGATLLGLIGVYAFPNGINNPELVSIEVVKTSLGPIFSALTLCAILAATTNVMAAQILVVASSLSEDFYKRLFVKEASHKQVLNASRVGVLIVGVMAYTIAFFKISSIYELVLYSWSGLGCSFGPLLLITLYYKKVTRMAALGGILVGGGTAAIWHFLGTDIPSMIPGFALSSLTIFVLSKMRTKP